MAGMKGDAVPSKEITPTETYFRGGRLCARSHGRGCGEGGGVVSVFQSAGFRLCPADDAAGKFEHRFPLPGTLPKPWARPRQQKPEKWPPLCNTDEPLTPFETVAGHNNFYEFTTDKQGVYGTGQGLCLQALAADRRRSGRQATTFDLDDLKAMGVEEHIYRHRCVEAWSMVVPWLRIPAGVSAQQGAAALRTHAMCDLSR